MMLSPFHLSIPVLDLVTTEYFYSHLLGCSVGRKTDCWIDFNFFGHQLSTHFVSQLAEEELCSEVDGKQVAVRHFGVVLQWQKWQEFAHLLQQQDISFMLAPQKRFVGQKGEQATMFLSDPSGNVLEFKSFKDEKQIFAT